PGSARRWSSRSACSPSPSAAPAPASPTTANPVGDQPPGVPPVAGHRHTVLIVTTVTRPDRTNGQRGDFWSDSAPNGTRCRPRAENAAQTEHNHCSRRSRLVGNLLASDGPGARQTRGVLRIVEVDSPDDPRLADYTRLTDAG